MVKNHFLSVLQIREFLFSEMPFYFRIPSQRPQSGTRDIRKHSIKAVAEWSSLACIRHKNIRIARAGIF
jgi:hypothetical protein